MKNIVIVGAGPSGLTAAYELLKNNSDYKITVLEESDQVGGISKTVNYKGNRMDMGGHRFFSKVPSVNEWWENMLPTQGALPIDDVTLGRTSEVKRGGPDPQKTDRVMLRRNRLSRILFNSKFFDYPITLRLSTIRNMGLGTTILVFFSYLKTIFYKRPEKSLEDFYINRFGKKLYSIFFENYTENLWGRHPKEIDPSWGAQRVKGLSILAVLMNAITKIFKKKSKHVETSLIEEFSYPKLGPGQLWELTAEEVKKKGGVILFNSRVVGIVKENKRIIGLKVKQDDKDVDITTDCLISSMPLKDLVCGMNDVPDRIQKIAEGLPYRDYMTIGVLVSHIKLQNKTKTKTIGNIVPDNWVYVHDKKVKMGRFQIYNNWSPYMVKDFEHTVWIGLEYFCNEGDELWLMSDEEFARLGISEMVSIGIIDKGEEVLDFHVERVKKAYPAYFDTYDQIDILRDWLNEIENLYCIGRNGQHRYNNIDHSMCTAFETVKNIVEGRLDKSNIWEVNTEQDYHEK